MEIISLTVEEVDTILEGMSTPSYKPAFRKSNLNPDRIIFDLCDHGAVMRHGLSREDAEQFIVSAASVGKVVEKGSFFHSIPQTRATSLRGVTLEEVNVTRAVDWKCSAMLGNFSRNEDEDGLICTIELKNGKLCSAHSDKKIRIWDLTEKKSPICFETDSKCYHLVELNDGRLVTVGRRLGIWAIGSKIFCQHKFELPRNGISSNLLELGCGRLCVGLDVPEGTIMVINLYKGSVEQSIERQADLTMRQRVPGSINRVDTEPSSVQWLEELPVGDGRICGVTRNNIFVWNIFSSECLCAIVIPMGTPSHAPANKSKSRPLRGHPNFIAKGLGGGRLATWLDPNSCTAHDDHSISVWHMGAIAMLAIGGGVVGSLDLASPDPRAPIGDTLSPTCVLQGHVSHIGDIIALQSGLLCSWSRHRSDPVIRLWHATDGTCVKELCPGGGWACAGGQYYLNVDAVVELASGHLYSTHDAFSWGVLCCGLAGAGVMAAHVWDVGAGVSTKVLRLGLSGGGARYAAMPLYDGRVCLSLPSALGIHGLVRVDDEDPALVTR